MGDISRTRSGQYGDIATGPSGDQKRISLLDNVKTKGGEDGASRNFTDHSRPRPSGVVAPRGLSQIGTRARPFLPARAVRQLRGTLSPKGFFRRR